MKEEPPAYDNHVHLRPDGRGKEAAKEFRAAGGSGMTLVNLPYPHIPVSNAEDIAESYRVTLHMAEEARSVPGLQVNVALGPYPVLLIPLSERYGLEKAEGIMMEAVDMAVALVQEGLAEALGEVGRPHFPVEAPIWESSNRILQHAMDRASECACPVIIHSESATSESMREFASMADSASLPRGMVIKHFAPPLNTAESGHGVLTSLPASRKAVREALKNDGPFLLETDYIDDPDRPGAVMSINSVPKRVKSLLASGEMDSETAWHIGRYLPERLYRR